MSKVPQKNSNLCVKILSDDLANQIAAGEVVERPMSVVKELVENSIDAGSTRILIEIEHGGKKLIRVTDNGTGMGLEDAELSFLRHATSKISISSDLENIVSLGFRGEALPSVASVAQVRMTTSADENVGGAIISIDGGGPSQTKQTSCPRGTVVEVAQLFYNTPARKKFLKGDSTESSHIAQVVTQSALAYPEVHFTLINNGRKVIDVLPTDQRLYRIAELFGPELAKELIHIDTKSGDYQLEGFVSSPVYSRSSRSAQYCYINQRFVRDKVIFHSTQHGYSHLLPKGQHPAIYLFLRMDPKLFDVNVHPAKAEVRFAFQQEVHRFISVGVKDALSASKKMTFSALGDSQDDFNNASDNIKTSCKSSFLNSFPKGHFSDEPCIPKDLISKHTSVRNVDLTSTKIGSSQIEIFHEKPIALSSLIYSEFEPLGQLDRSFILMQGKLGILLVDQHIAHERVLYDRFSKAARDKKVETQQLLFPLTLEFSPSEAELLTRYQESLGQLGLEFELFGKNEFLLRTVPAILKNNDKEEIVRGIVDMLPAQKHEEALNQKFEEILIMMSCRNAITVNTSLSLDQINRLILDLQETEMPYTCPHGRPIALLYDMDSILKKFLRK